jgi:hypothetical protein
MMMGRVQGERTKTANFETSRRGRARAQGGGASVKVNPALNSSAHPQASAAWQRRKISLGLCSCCGREPLVPGRTEGLACILRKRVQARKRRGFQPGRVSGRGRRVIHKRVRTTTKPL